MRVVRNVGAGTRIRADDRLRMRPCNSSVRDSVIYPIPRADRRVVRCLLHLGLHMDLLLLLELLAVHRLLLLFAILLHLPPLVFIIIVFKLPVQLLTVRVKAIIFLFMRRLNNVLLVVRGWLLASG